MRKITFVNFAAVALLGAAPAGAQYYGGIPTGRIILDACYDPNFPRDPALLQKVVIPYADQAMDKYLGLARSSSKLDKMFTGTREHRLMFIDGVQVDPRTAHDPWASRVARLKPLGYVQSNEDFNTHAQWQAFAADGTPLGIYDALIRVGMGGYHFRQLSLVSSGSNVQPDVLKPFCMDPGDIEKWQADKARREAEKAAKQAAREASKAN